ncbi:MAG TPA: transcription factor [Candidatus Angelobacter sp.]|jgi:hypothetical protein
MDPKIKKSIKGAIDGAPRNAYVVELHAQILKYAGRLQNIKGKEFCAALEIRKSYGTEFSKMMKLAQRLENTGLETARI